MTGDTLTLPWLRHGPQPSPTVGGRGRINSLSRVAEEGWGPREAREGEGIDKLALKSRHG